MIGYHEQSLETQLENVKITTDLGSSPSCGYSWPYNGGGCDTNQLLAKVQQYVGSEITSFYGCYHASNWTISNDLQVASNCGAYGGYQLYTYFPQNTTTGSNTEWTRMNFITADKPPCSGGRYVRYNTEYALWVGAILCGTNSRYKLYLSDASDHDFLQIADYGGHGQDHCELVNPEFSIATDDDITSAHGVKIKEKRSMKRVFSTKNSFCCVSALKNVICVVSIRNRDVWQHFFSNGLKCVSLLHRFLGSRDTFAHSLTIYKVEITVKLVLHLT